MSIILTRDQVRRVDQLAVERYGISGIVLMENAGRNAASIISSEYGSAGNALICCGPGNNGGDGCVIARHLHNDGWSVRLLVTGDESRMSPDMLTNYQIARAMGLRVQATTDGAEQATAAATVHGDEILVDALLGTGFQGTVRAPTDRLIKAINAAGARAVVAVDVPSGLDCETGEPSNATVRADLTITFVAIKAGFTLPAAQPFVGRLHVADIGAPRELIAEIAGSES
jgi:NAD(P)H-hydrate epimerase